MAKKEVVKTKKGYRNSPVIGDNLINLKEGDIANITREALTIALWDKIDKNDPDELWNRAVEYLNYCIENDSKPGNMGLYNAWGIDRREISVISNTETSERADIIKKSRKILAEIRERLMSDGKINPITGIFWQKNYDGLKDVQDVVLTPNSRNVEAMDQKEILQIASSGDLTGIEDVTQLPD